MKLLINNIKRQIEQLDSRELKQWLLRNLNLNANQLTELFCTQYPTQNIPHTETRLSNSPLFSLLRTYGSQALVDEFTSVLPEQSSLDIDSFQQGLLEQSIRCLNDFRDVWPLISQIIAEPKNLIEVMQKASPKVLEAFKRLYVHSDWALLIEVFLIKDENKLEINRWRLISFLRSSSWIEELKIVKAEAKVLFTLCFHIQAFDTKEPAEHRVQRLMAFCQEYPFAPAHLSLMEFISFYSRLLTREDSLAINKEFIRLLDGLLKNLSIQEQKELIKSFDANILDSLIEHCIENHPLLTPIYQEAYKGVLFLLCRQAVDLGEIREVIQRQLNQIEKRSESSQKEKDLFSLEQVILSPHFMETVTPLLIKKLMLRYSCFILTLNQDELIYFITPAKELSPYYETFISHLLDIEKQLAHDPEQSNLLAQRERLLHWCIERSAHALLAELIRRCEQQNNKTALTSIYNYYFEHYFPLRADLRDAAASHFYEMDRVSADPSNLSALENWRKDYLREEAQTQNGPYLYNARGQCRAFIDESNKVWSLIGEPVLLNAASENEEELFYNQDGLVVGTITDAGYFSCLTTRRTLSAQLLNTLPNEELERSPRGLYCLINDLLVENSLDILYEYFERETEKGQLKCFWLEPMIAQVLSNAGYPISSATLNTVIIHFHEDRIFSLWTCIENSSNARSFFHSILNNEKTRERLFLKYGLPAFALFLNTQGVVNVLADYLIRFHKEPWFLEGLSLFATYARDVKDKFLLPKALAFLVTKVHQVQLSVDVLDDVLLSLVSSKKAALILLQEFYQDKLEAPVQELSRDELDQVGTYFHKQHLLFLLKQLNSLSSWQNEPVYRLTLIILYSQYERLLQATRSQWTQEELKVLSVFTNRHLLEKNTWDSHSSIGFKLLGSLLFYCSAAGQTNLFFTGRGELNPLSRYSITPALLAQLVDYFVLASSQEKRSAVQAWNTLMMSPHHKIQNNIPILCVYLLHYSGPTDPVARLLAQYFNHYAQSEILIRPLAAFLLNFPERDISGVIFDNLQKAIIKNPMLLDPTTFSHMAHYYVHQQKLLVKDEMDAKVHLLTAWGQTSYYELAHRGCVILLSLCQDDSLRTRVLKAEVESRIEAEIQQLLQSPSLFANTVKWCKRIWHYGFQWEKNRSQLLALSDESVLHSNLPRFSAATITILNEQSEQKAIKQAQPFINLLAEVVRSVAHSTAKELLGKTKQTLFGAVAPPPSPSLILAELASKPVGAHV